MIFVLKIVIISQFYMIKFKITSMLSRVVGDALLNVLLVKTVRQITTCLALIHVLVLEHLATLKTCNYFKIKIIGLKPILSLNRDF